MKRNMDFHFKQAVLHTTRQFTGGEMGGPDEAGPIPGRGSVGSGAAPVYCE